jgi:4-hydroxybenzoate polyprenyltransferase
MSSVTVWKGWAEILSFIVLIIGFLFSISMDNPAYIYIVIFLAGLLAGRYYFLKIGKQPLFPFFLITIGFLVGYVIGAPIKANANVKVVIVLFFLGWLISHIAHKKRYIPR